jgi:flagellar biosynthesis protein FlhF
MHTKRFVAADMRRALTLVRDELGEDAMILSTQRTAKGVEIVASAEEIPAEGAAASGPSKPFGAIPRYEGSSGQQGSTQQRATQASSSQNSSSYNSSPQNSSSQNYDFQPQATQGQFNEPRAYQPVSSSLQQNARGPASGKTQDELGEEMEQARRRIIAMQKEENLTLSEWADRQQPQRRSSPAPQSVQAPPLEPAPVQTSQVDISTIKDTIKDTLKEAEIKSDIKGEKDSQEIRRLQDEIASMRSFFSGQLASMAEAQERHFQDQQASAEIVPLMADVKQRLSNMGLTRACNDEVIRSLKSFDDSAMSTDQLWAESLARVVRKIPVITHDPVSTGGIYAFLGTTGVGKTTTIAKLAARYVMENGPEHLALLTTDNYRIAAHDQLRSLGHILKVPVKVVDDLSQLPKILSSFSKQALVLIDTPGMSYNDPLLKPHLTALRRCPHIQSALVLSANSQYQMMQASLHSYRIANPAFCVMTKLDECASLGDAISLLIANDLPLAYSTDGQSVPDDLAVIKPHHLVTKAVKLSKVAARMDKHTSKTV